MSIRRQSWIRSGLIGALLVGCGFAYFFFFDRPEISTVELGPYLEKLRSAHHYESPKPVRLQPIKELQDHGVKQAALHTLGKESWHIPKFWTGEPEAVFEVLSMHGGLGEIIWVDEWKNFPVEMPSGFPTRNELVDSAIDAINAAGGSVVAVGKDRVLIVNESERKYYEAAVKFLGWDKGTNPPWATNETTGL